MFEFYLTIIDSIAKSQQHNFLSKFNKLVYAEEELSSDEKFYLLGEMQKKWNKFSGKSDKGK